MGRRTWIKIYCDKWLRGSIREETLETRAIWIDILTLAGDSAFGDDGVISVAPGCGYTDEQIARILGVSLQVWKKNKEILKKTERISNNKTGEIIITNWKTYQSEYARQKEYRQSDNGKLQKKVTEKSYKQKREERRENKKREYKKEIYIVFAYWQKIFDHSRSKLTKDRKAKIRTRLNEGYSINDLKRTIDGCKASSYHMGDNDQGKIYDSIELLFRNGDKVEQFWGYLKKEEYQTQLSKAKRELGKLGGKDKILKWLLVLPKQAHEELRRHLDKVYRQGHSFAEAKDEWENRNRSPP